MVVRRTFFGVLVFLLTSITLSLAQAPCDRHIIAIGGSSFRMEPYNLLIDRYILKVTGKDHPRIGFIGAASQDNSKDIEAFYKAYQKLGAIPSHFETHDQSSLKAFRDFLDDLDVVFVGGGNTLRMMELWRRLGFDQELKDAHDGGLILAGVSAGGICWFCEGISDSNGPLSVVKGLGILKGSFAPHSDWDKERAPSLVESLAMRKTSPPGYAVDDHVALHFVNGQLKRALSSHIDKRVHYFLPGGHLTAFPKPFIHLSLSNGFIVREASRNDVISARLFLNRSLPGAKNIFDELFDGDIHQMIVAVEAHTIVGVAQIVKREKGYTILSYAVDNNEEIETALRETATARAEIFGIPL
jgi:peptidase E